MTRETFDKLRDLALQVNKMVQEEFPDERVVISINRFEDCPVDIEVGEVDKYEGFYIYHDIDWAVDNKKYTSRKCESSERFPFEVVAS